MADLSEILRLLEAERDRYVLEAADLERRLSIVRNQMTTLEALISGYALEEQSVSPYRRLLESSGQAFLDDTPRELDGHTRSQPVQEDFASSKESEEEEPDISDIPKLNVPRKPGTLPLLPEFQDYSIQNAILILMRRKPHLHFHVDAIVRDLYGDKLTPDQFKTAKTNVSKMLSTGTQMGMWYRVLHALGMYTLNHEKGVTSKQTKTK
ncbi:MAG: hypothetical protein ACHBN1_13495 [Heteroscytonema crispum UTEX LB 1556]